ncbi:copper resistance protein NlpE N-terminal domain-containing protein [Paralcaligenes sp. KSB-10]|uniref:copper resistance protein NlpE N-terminal domain-containing protein n=1 Tax=Paralcaligenes sp. KSB-10 TaxID=2901142 RepID=UPI001E381D02|nr:copper resistance protein NlpE N-terminal domain-containing protein [Paralcaligenes sp. KSB-10]UHL63984.1 copper resistance protein NlpE N-terminal domain-containing protein [Paralcaligenes sp. KSB-10]
MHAFASRKLRPILYALSITVSAVMLAGCAQQRAAGFYDQPRDNTQHDAEAQAQGRAYTRAPSQIQLGFGNTQKPNQGGEASPQAESAVPASTRPLTEAKTFLGTIPCLADSNACSATRITLTLAPSGEWRARTAFLGGATANKKIVQQGCWEVVGTTPLRIVLQLKNRNTKANLTFVTDNLLRINSIDSITPNLDYRLTRQADVDAISELNKEPAMQCGN